MDVHEHGVHEHDGKSCEHGHAAVQKAVHEHDGEACGHDHGHAAAPVMEQGGHAHSHDGKPCDGHHGGHGHDHGHSHAPRAPPSPLEGAAGADISPDHDGGLFKQILREGDAEAGSPPAGAMVKVHYVGTLADGTKFDSSRDRPGFFEFQLGVKQVIKGWDAGIATMKKGELALLTCRSDYAYGDGGSGKIPPGATLTFEVELFSWKQKRRPKHMLDTAGRLAEASELKALGTDALKSGKLAEALEIYSEASQFVEGEEGEEATALALSCLLNSAMCALKLHEFGLADETASRALAIDPQNVKALFRRGTARMHRGDFGAAKGDLKAAATLNPKDKAVRDVFVDCQAREAAAKQKEKGVYGKMFG